MGDPIRDEILAVYEAVGRSGAAAPLGLGVPTDRELALRLGYRAAELEGVPDGVLAAFVGAGALAEGVQGSQEALVLDLGCGAGLDAWILTRRGYRVAGLDASGTMLRRMTSPDRRARRGPSGVRALLPWLPLRPAVAGWALLNGVANLVPERRALLQEIGRVLRPGGVLLAADLIAVGEVPPELRELPEAWAWCVGGATGRGAWEKDLAAGGFREVEVTALEEIPPFARALIRARRP